MSDELDTTIGPLLAQVRRRHPDVDIVVLPEPHPASVPDTPAPSMAPAAAAALARRGTATVEDLLARLDGEPGPVVELWWAQGASTYKHVSRAIVRAVDSADASAGDPAAALRARLSETGWQVAPAEPPGAAVRAAYDGLTLLATAYPTATEVEVVTDAVVLDADAVEAVRLLLDSGAGR